MSTEQDKILYSKLNLETAKIEWKDLERFFASGRLISVHEMMDMVAVAKHMADDNVEEIKKLLADNKIVRTTDDQARKWSEINAELWAVVVRPWILVQEPQDKS